MAQSSSSKPKIKGLAGTAALLSIFGLVPWTLTNCFDKELGVNKHVENLQGERLNSEALKFLTSAPKVALRSEFQSRTLLVVARVSPENYKDFEKAFGFNQRFAASVVVESFLDYIKQHSPNNQPARVEGFQRSHWIPELSGQASSYTNTWEVCHRLITEGKVFYVLFLDDTRLGRGNRSLRISIK